MATISAADRTGPNHDLLDNAVVDASPAFPFYYTPNNGFTALNPAMTYTPGLTEVDCVIGNVPNTEVVLAVCEARNIMVTNLGIYHFASGWGTASSTDTQYDPVPVYQEGVNCTLRFSGNSKDDFTVSVVMPDGTTSTATHTVTDLFAGNPTFHLGYLTDSQLANADGLVPAYDAKLISMTLVP